MKIAEVGNNYYTFHSTCFLSSEVLDELKRLFDRHILLMVFSTDFTVVFIDVLKHPRFFDDFSHLLE